MSNKPDTVFVVGLGKLLLTMKLLHLEILLIYPIWGVNKRAVRDQRLCYFPFEQVAARVQLVLAAFGPRHWSCLVHNCLTTTN